MRIRSLFFICSLFMVFPSQAQEWNCLNFAIRNFNAFGQNNNYWVLPKDNASYTWLTTGSLQIVSGQGTTSVSVSGCGTLSIILDGGHYQCTDSIEVACEDPNPGPDPDPNCVPTFQVMSPNWNNLGETCPDFPLELAIMNECPATVDYQWSIMGATVTGSTPDNRYIFVRTSPNIGQFLTFRVRAVYANGTTSAWYTLNGITIHCGNIGIQQ